MPGVLGVHAQPTRNLRSTRGTSVSPARAFAAASSSLTRLPGKNAVAAPLGQVRWRLLWTLQRSVLVPCLISVRQLPPRSPLCRFLGDILWPRTGTKHCEAALWVWAEGSCSQFPLQEPCSRTARHADPGTCAGPHVTHANAPGSSLPTIVG